MIFTHNTSFEASIDLIIPVFKEQTTYQSVLAKEKIQGIDFKGDFSKFLKIHTNSGRRIYLLGLGEEKHRSRIHEAFRKLSFKCNQDWSEKIQLDGQYLDGHGIQSAVLGIEMASYKIGIYKSKIEHKSQETTIDIICNAQDSKKIIEGRSTGETINRIKTLVDAPPNYKTPEILSKWSINSARQYGYNCKILSANDLKNEGLEALLAVGQGSEHPPCLIINSYIPHPDKKIELGLVGKGITFDSGGISIKPAENLHYMKSDMGGAAAVLGAVELAARLQLDINVIGIVAAAENTVDSKSFRPGDVIGSYSGKTIEVIDTDAEGRLVLADALSYIIKQYQPEKIIDLATLTGSAVRSLGYSAGGIFTDNKEMEIQLTHVGIRTHERVWPLPLFEDYKEYLESDIADIKNLGNTPLAGASIAALFLETFTESHKNWVHLDIAGVAFGSSDYTKMKSATGYGVRLLIEYMKSIKL